MNDKALEKFKENYANAGDCKDLPSFLKSFTKKFRKTNTEKKIEYYPWAVVERIFRMQGGKVEVNDWAKKVEFQSQEYEPDLETGELIMQEKTSHALFMHLKGFWQDEELDEFYPLFDNQNAKIIKNPDAMDLNTARQRGSVRLIARLSGIGLDIFEQQDSQFNDNPQEEGEKIVVNKKKEEETEENKPTKAKSKPKPKTKPKAQAKKEKDKEKQEEAMAEVVEDDKEEVEVEKADDEEKLGEGFLGPFLNGEEVEPEIAEAAEEQQKAKEGFEKEQYDKNSEEYAALLLDVRKAIRKNNFQIEAKKYVESIHKNLLSELDYSELEELMGKMK